MNQHPSMPIYGALARLRSEQICIRYSIDLTQLTPELTRYFALEDAISELKYAAELVKQERVARSASIACLHPVNPTNTYSTATFLCTASATLVVLQCKCGVGRV